MGPGTCGEADLRPVSEITYPKRAEQLKPRPMWIGNQFNGLLLGDSSTDRNTISFLFSDCSLLDSAECPPNLTVRFSPGLRADDRQ